jgi:hypothetical protein
MSIEDLHALFPNLSTTGHRLTSPPDMGYNCIAWVHGDKQQWWEPFGVIIPAPPPEYYWPNGVPSDHTVAAYAALFARIGYSPCDSGTLEAGVEKIVCYSREGVVRHVAKQLASGFWTSKLGVAEDIEHTLEGLQDNTGPYSYGDPSHFFARPRAAR